jgi:hypothetical protein
MNIENISNDNLIDSNASAVIFLLILAKLFVVCFIKDANNFPICKEFAKTNDGNVLNFKFSDNSDILVNISVDSENFSITSAFVSRQEVPECVDLSKLPEDASETLRLVYVGDYDICACIGLHVENTSEIGTFKIISTDYSEGKFRIRFKLDRK